MTKQLKRPVAADEPRSSAATVGRRRWRGLEFQARLLTEVFGVPVSAERVVQAVVGDALRHAGLAV